MISLIIKLLSGPLVNAILGVINKHYEVKQNQDVLKADLLKAVLDTSAEVAKTNASVIEAEIKSEHWLVANWRPLVAMSSFGVLMWYSVAVPILVNWAGYKALAVGDLLLNWIYTICLTCITGYGTLRTVEKVTDVIAGMWRR